jgi:hypothetical protein
VGNSSCALFGKDVTALIGDHSCTERAHSCSSWGGKCHRDQIFNEIDTLFLIRSIPSQICSVEYATVTVGEDACLGDGSCLDFYPNVIASIGNRSCHGDKSCRKWEGECHKYQIFG